MSEICIIKDKICFDEIVKIVMETNTKDLPEVIENFYTIKRIIEVRGFTNDKSV